MTRLSDFARLRCSTPGCRGETNAVTEHVENLTAGGWRCAECSRQVSR